MVTKDNGYSTMSGRNGESRLGDVIDGFRGREYVRRAIGAGVIPAVLLLAACGSDDEPTEASKAPTTASASATPGATSKSPEVTATPTPVEVATPSPSLTPENVLPEGPLGERNVARGSLTLNSQEALKANYSAEAIAKGESIRAMPMGEFYNLSDEEQLSFSIYSAMDRITTGKYGAFFNLTTQPNEVPLRGSGPLEHPLSENATPQEIVNAITWFDQYQQAISTAEDGGGNNTSLPLDKDSALKLLPGNNYPDTEAYVTMDQVIRGRDSTTKQLSQSTLDGLVVEGDFVATDVAFELPNGSMVNGAKRFVVGTPNIDNFTYTVVFTGSKELTDLTGATTTVGFWRVLDIEKVEK